MRLFLLILVFPALLFGQRLSGLDGVAEEIRFANPVLGVGIRGIAMGGAHISASDDYSSTFYNPANLSFMTRPELSASISHTNMKNTTIYNGVESNRDRSKTRIEYLGGVYVIPTERGGASVAVSGGRIYPFDGILYGKDDSREFLEISNGGVYGVDFSGGIQVAPGLGLGATFRLLTGSENYSWDLERYYADDDLQKVIISDNITYDYSGLGLKFGLTYSPLPFLRLAGTIDFPQSITI